MTQQQPHSDDGMSEELLRRALLDNAAAVSVSLRVEHLPLSEAVTVIFHARRDLGTLQTYVAAGSRGAGAKVAPSELLRVPCDLDLAEAHDRRDAERLYVQQASVLRDALVATDIVLDVWRGPLQHYVGHTVTVERTVELGTRLPAPRLLPTVLIDRESHLVVAPVCSARTLAEGRPPLGIACAQQDFARIYPLADDPARCVEEFLDLSADHARELAVRLDHQEASLERFLELSEPEFD